MLARRGDVDIDVMLHPNEHVAATMRASLGGWPAIRLIDPCGHSELVARMRAATLVLSDSGGIQEEAPALGVPLLVLRDKTERPEGLACGNARLVGTSTERIVGEVERLIADPAALAAMSRRAFPYGDGHSAPRIAAIVDQWLEVHGARVTRNSARPAMRSTEFRSKAALDDELDLTGSSCRERRARSHPAAPPARRYPAATTAQLAHPGIFPCGKSSP